MWDWRVSCGEWSPVCSTLVMLSTVPFYWHIHFPSQLPGFYFFCFTSTSTFLPSLSEASLTWAAFMNELSLFFFFFFMNERLSLTSCDGACRLICEWSGERDWQTAPEALSPSLTYKLPSNHRRVGWLMLYTHTHIHFYTEAEPIQ